MSRIGGVGLDALASEIEIRHDLAHPKNPTERAHRDLWYGGEYQWRREGEYHLFNPETVFKLQHATRAGRYDIFKQYTKLVDDQAAHLATLRGLFSFKLEGARRCPSTRSSRSRKIVKRFNTGAMSYGSISKEAHENAGHRHEPHRRQEQHRRRRRRRRALPSPIPTATCAAARSSRSRRDDSASPANTSSTPTSCRSRWRRAPSRARAASFPGNKVDAYIGKLASLHARRRPDLAAAASRHLFDRRSRAAHPRSEERQPQARVSVKLVAEVGVGTVAAGRRQSQGRSHSDLRRRRRHRRVAPDQHQARRHPLGARPRRNAADAGDERPARPHRRADRWPAQDRPRCRDRRAARRRRSSASPPRRWSPPAAS